MKAPGIVRRHPELRWLVAFGAVAAVAVAITTSISGTFRDDDALPATSPAELAAKVLDVHDTGYSGTVVSQLNLGLPKAVTTAVAGLFPSGGALIAGSHTLRYWYGGEQKQRVALVTQNSEQDVFRSGATLWYWDTRTRIAHHTSVPVSAGSGALDATSDLPLTVAPTAALTPPQLAERVLQLGGGGDSSDMTLRSGRTVANRSTYELVVRPESSASLIDSVRVDIDGREMVPLSVEVFAHGQQRPAMEVAFTSITYTMPAAQNFTFSPPRGARVSAGPPAVATDVATPALLGTGWETTASYDMPADRAAAVGVLFGSTLSKVTGAWGKGELFVSPMLSVLVVDPARAGATARMVVGAVSPEVLYRAAAAS